MPKLTEIEGIGPEYAGKLETTGLKTTDDLLAKGATPQGRQELAEATGIDTKRILGWVNRADLFRIKGVGEEYADLLECTGVDTVPELAQRNAANLYTTLESTNTEKKLVRALPTQNQVQEWVDQAKSLPRKVEY